MESVSDPQVSMSLKWIDPLPSPLYPNLSQEAVSNACEELQAVLHKSCTPP